jgi:hypothetical protein
VLADRLPDKSKVADLRGKTLKKKKVVREDNKGSNNVTQRSVCKRCKCDYLDCHKAYQRREHLKRHKET